MSHYANKLLLLICGIGYAMFFEACDSHAEKGNQAPDMFEVIVPIVQDTVYTREYVADIQSVQNVEVRSRVRAVIETIGVDEGKSVKQGQVLFTLSSNEFQEDLLMANAQLKSAMAELKAADVEIRNMQLLLKEEVISAAELEIQEAKRDAVQARMEEARSAITVAKINLSFTRIRAPFSGTINRIPNKAGSLVEEGTLLTSVSNNRDVFAYFNVSEREYFELQKQRNNGQQNEVQLQLADGGILPNNGIIETIESEIDKHTGNLAFRARFANPEGLLKHGSSAKVLLNIPLHQAMMIPQRSTIEVQDKLYVYVLRNKNTVTRREINPLLRLPHFYVVASGLQPQEEIVYEGVQRIRDNQQISPKLLPSGELLAQLTKQ